MGYRNGWITSPIFSSGPLGLVLIYLSYKRPEGNMMSMSMLNKGSKTLKILGVLALVGVVITVARLVLKGIRSANTEPEDEHNGI